MALLLEWYFTRRPSQDETSQAAGCKQGRRLLCRRRVLPGLLEPSGRGWQRPYQHFRNLQLSATVYHTNISKFISTCHTNIFELPTALPTTTTAMPSPRPRHPCRRRHQQIKICDVQAVELMWDLISLT